MAYRLDRGLFLENGAAVLVARDRAARAASIAYNLVRTARPAVEPVQEATNYSAAA